MDREKAIDIIAKDMSISNEDAQRMYENIGSFSEGLKKVVRGYFDGERKNYSYKGVSIKDIMEKENASYLNAIFSMDLLMKNPEILQVYDKFTFKKDMVIGRNDWFYYSEKRKLAKYDLWPKGNVLSKFRKYYGCKPK